MGATHIHRPQQTLDSSPCSECGHSTVSFNPTRPERPVPSSTPFYRWNTETQGESVLCVITWADRAEALQQPARVATGFCCVSSWVPLSALMVICVWHRGPLLRAAAGASLLAFSFLLLKAAGFSRTLTCSSTLLGWSYRNTSQRMPASWTRDQRTAHSHSSPGTERRSEWR